MQTSRGGQYYNTLLSNTPPQADHNLVVWGQLQDKTAARADGAFLLQRLIRPKALFYIYSLLLYTQLFW